MLWSRVVPNGLEDGALAIVNACQIFVDRCGGPTARCDRVDDRLRPGHDVAAGKHARTSGRQCPGVRNDCRRATDLDPGALGKDRWIGFLPDRHEDGAWPQAPARSRRRVPRWQSRLLVGATGRAGRLAAKPDQCPVATDDLDRSEAGEDDDLLTFGGFDLLDLRRHLCSAASIDDGHRRRAAAPGGARGIHRRAATADDDGRTAQARFLTEVDALEEQRGRDDLRVVVAGNTELPALRGAGRHEHRAVTLRVEVAEREIAPHRGIQPKVDPKPDDARDLGLQDVSRQAIRRDADGHHATWHGHRLEDGDGVAEPSEVIGG